jgi:hypothetical protein
VRQIVYRLLKHARRSRRTRQAAIAAAAFALAFALPSRESAAQARTVITPAVGVGAVYDDNILWRPDAESDHISRISPALSFIRESPTDRLIGDFSFDGEWFSRHRDLSTPAARQHASLESRWAPTPVSTLTLAGAYDSSLSPGDINLGTAITLGRTRAWRLAGGPKLALSLSGRYDLTAGYQATSEQSDITPDTFTHEADIGISEAITERNGWRARYFAEAFLFQGADRVMSHTGLFGWTHRWTPELVIFADGGVRFAAHRTRPEVDVQLNHRATYTSGLLEYAWTQTSTLGVATLIEVQRINGSWSYEPTRRVSASLIGGVYFNDFGDTRIDIYRGGADIGLPLGSILTLHGSYTLDYQRGRLVPPVLLPLSGGAPAGFDSGLLVTPAAIPVPDERVRRGVVLVRLVLSGDLRNPRKEPVDEPGRRRRPAPGEGQ